MYQFYAHACRRALCAWGGGMSAYNHKMLPEITPKHPHDPWRNPLRIQLRSLALFAQPRPKPFLLYTEQRDSNSFGASLKALRCPESSSCHLNPRFLPPLWARRMSLKVVCHRSSNTLNRENEQPAEKSVNLAMNVYSFIALFYLFDLLILIDFNGK